MSDGRDPIIYVYCALRQEFSITLVAPSISIDKIQELIKAIDNQFVTFEKTLASTLIMKLTSLHLTIIRDVGH